MTNLQIYRAFSPLFWFYILQLKAFLSFSSQSSLLWLVTFQQSVLTARRRTAGGQTQGLSGEHSGAFIS